ncbi:MAG: hypothetical protein QF886_27125, partial [Planctomycetota bacterium]|nr:hypothetical protein [Planctomycetota bacterium]
MSLRFIEPLKSNLLWRYPVPNLADGFRDLWQQTRQLVLKATYYDQLFPPLWGPLGKAQESLAGIHVCPVDAVIAVGGKCIWNADSELDFADFLRCLYRLLEEASYQTGDGKFWLADNPEAFGFLYQEGQSLRFLPGPVMVLEEHLELAVKAGAMREIPAAFQTDWNAKVLASLLKNAVIAYFPNRPAEYANLWISLIEMVDG